VPIAWPFTVTTSRPLARARSARSSCRELRPPQDELYCTASRHRRSREGDLRVCEDPDRDPVESTGMEARSTARPRPGRDRERERSPPPPASRTCCTSLGRPQLAVFEAGAPVRLACWAPVSSRARGRAPGRGRAVAGLIPVLSTGVTVGVLAKRAVTLTVIVDGGSPVQYQLHPARAEASRHDERADRALARGLTVVTVNGHAIGTPGSKTALRGIVLAQDYRALIGRQPASLSPSASAGRRGVGPSRVARCRSLCPDPREDRRASTARGGGVRLGR